MPDEKDQDTLERRRAKDAYDYLKELRKGRNLKKLCTRVQGLPVAVRSEGLTVAVATLLKEDRRESRDLADLIARWLLNGSGVVGSHPDPVTARSLLDHAIDCSRAEYLVLQAEALAYLDHVKRLASALEKAS
jgi:CRISPR-associated protein (Cas_Cmr5)